jgi:hypothetical protein
MPTPPLVSALARSILAGEPSVSGIVGRLTRILGKKWRWVQPLARRYVDRFLASVPPRHRQVVQFLLADEALTRARSDHRARLQIADWRCEAPQMQPAYAAKGWPVPALTTVASLAEWLQLTPSELEWFTDRKGLSSKLPQSALEGPVSHYRYRILAKNFGSIRLIEAPKPRLKQLQRQILAGILEAMPVHPAAHGFLKNHSVQTFAASHVGRQVVLRMDLQDFFPSIRRARIAALFRTAGYPESIADLLAALCTHVAPRGLFAKSNFAEAIHPAQLRDAQLLYTEPHLPQGAPSSPALANLCAYRVDCRLAGLAHAADAVYTRYADDLAFSGGEAFARTVDRFQIQASAILLEEGFQVHHRKTRIMRPAVRQYLAGLVTNQRLNVPRPDFDRLKAILTNCLRHGPESQNREAHPAFRAHIEGRVGFVESVNPQKGARLRRIFDQIDWETPPTG